MPKRRSCRAIIIANNSLITMYRKKDNKVYYVFPGGGMEDNEDFDTCIIRECKEEFGIEVNPIKHVYTYENGKSIQYFYLCHWIDGELGSGEGEEFQDDRNRGIYMPTMIPLSEISNIPLVPTEVSKTLVEDIKAYGTELSNELKTFDVE